MQIFRGGDVSVLEGLETPLSHARIHQTHSGKWYPSRAGAGSLLPPLTRKFAFASAVLRTRQLRNGIPMLVLQMPGVLL
jgi:hypothetical protein